MASGFDAGQVTAKILMPWGPLAASRRRCNARNHTTEPGRYQLPPGKAPPAPGLKLKALYGAHAAHSQEKILLQPFQDSFTGVHDMPIDRPFTLNRVPFFMATKMPMCSQKDVPIPPGPEAALSFASGSSPAPASGGRSRKAGHFPRGASSENGTLGPVPTTASHHRRPSPTGSLRICP